MADIETDEIRDFRETERNGTERRVIENRKNMYRRKLKKKKKSLKVEKRITETENKRNRRKKSVIKKPTGRHGNRDRDNEHRTI